MSLWRDPGYYRDEAAQYRKRAATTSDSAELRDSYLALARSYERLADTLSRRGPSTDMARAEDQQTVAFLRMAATELAHIAERTPDVAKALLRLADELWREATDMEKRG